MKLVLATNNRHKIEEIKAYLTTVEILPRENFDLKEEGETLRENALQKARLVAVKAGMWALADDTGLFVDALDGRPGILSARYAGEQATAQDNIKKLLKELEGLSFEKRGAHFETVVALVHPDGREITVSGKLNGTIAEKSSGREGFGYDPVFWISSFRCTLAEIPLEQKNRISHRGKALEKLKTVLATKFFGV